ncbi:alkyl/aryl-sulfatase [Phenylobacterium sp.]|jgi:alkyl sulfatase BDS1-like metallo-beta-lactamase superfamily hydrolase|uniref:alkyl/aryl-sulfatase n=1 Tax=Phenylobacterium sp. TaxID=1871053 RepID=UPI002F944797
MRVIGAWALLLGVSLSSTNLHAAPDPKDRQDFAFAERGFVGTRAEPKIVAADGRVVWDLAAYDFIKGTAPASVNPSLWRQAQLLSKHGLFKVTDGVWQVRGFDIANVTFVAGRTGWIVIDPLTAAETARAALDLANEKLGARPVLAVIYTHSHVDHFGGARGVLPADAGEAAKVQVIAPAGFLEHAVSENIIAGAAMSRRAVYQFGTSLPRSTTGQVSAGIGQAPAAGTQTLVPPTRDITRTGEELTVDGVRMQFQLTPATEAPAEMNIYFPDLKLLDLAENANATLHNVLTPRGALVRDAKAWADYLSESLRLYGSRTDVLMTSHAWPRFGRATIVDYVGKHRDAYKFLHDQSVRLMNEGLTGPEIANRLKLPEVLDREWYNRGYYGTLSFNARAVYQRYMGWYDANPVNLAPLEPTDESARYVAIMGGAERVLAEAGRAFSSGDDRWAATLANRVVLADPRNTAARGLLARIYDRLAAQAESALSRNMYLTASQELRTGATPARGAAGGAPDLIRNTPTPMLLDLMAVRLDPAKVGAETLALDLAFPERQERYRVTVRHQVLTYEPLPAAGRADAAVSLPRAEFLALAGGQSPPQSGAQGDIAALRRFFGWLTPPRGDFPVVWR